MKIFITGHKGFLGTHFTNYIDSNKSKDIQWTGYDLSENKNDICDKYSLDFHIRKFNPDIVIHLAAKAGVTESKIYPNEYIQSNIIGTQNLVDICENNKIKNLIFLSSSSVYGNISEEFIKESNVKNPSSLYGITKLAGEHIVNNSDLNTAIIRPFTIYGPQGRPDGIIYKWISEIKKHGTITIYGDVSSYRGYVYYEDLIKAILTICEAMIKNDKSKLPCKHEDFNLSGSKIYLKDIVDVFEEFVPNIEKIYIERPKEDIYGQIADGNKAWEFLNFNPPVKFKDNLRKILKKEL